MKYWCKECRKIVPEEDIIGMRVKGKYYERCPDCIDRHGLDADDTLEPCRNGWYLEGEYIGTFAEVEKKLIHGESIGTLHNYESFGVVKTYEVTMTYILEELIYEDWVPSRFDTLVDDKGNRLPFICYWTRGILENYPPTRMLHDALRDKDLQQNGFLYCGALIYAGDDCDDE